MMNFHDYKSVETRLNDTDIYTLIADCDTILAENPTEFMRLLRSALSLSAHVLEKDKSALAHQLAGRLYHHVDKNADIKAFVDGITPPKNSLYPIYNGYDPLLPAGEVATNLMIHKGAVIKIKILSDKRILSWSEDSTLHLWSDEGISLKTFRGHTATVWGASELSDGRILSWGDDNTLRLWDKDGNLLNTLYGHTSWVSNALQLSDGRILSCSLDHTLRLWDKDGRYLAILEGHTDVVDGAYELPHGRILSSARFNSLRIWDRNGNLIKILTDDDIWSHRTRILLDGRIVSVGSDKNVRLWDTNGELLAIFDNFDWGEDCEDRFERWALEHNFDGNIIYYHRDTPLLMGRFDVWEEADRLIPVLDYETMKEVFNFYGDNSFRCLTITQDNIVVAGDHLGRVIFLRWVE